MLSLLLWLTNVQFIIGAFVTFAFIASAWLNISSWTVRKEFKTSLRALGFLILAIWSALHGIGPETTLVGIVIAITLAVGSLVIAVSYAINKPSSRPKNSASLHKKQQEEKITQVLHGPPETNKPHPPKPGAPLTTQPEKTAAHQEQSSPREAPRHSVSLESNRQELRTKTLINLPKSAKRHKIRLTLGLLSLLITLAAFAAIGYFLFSKSFMPSTKPEPQPIIEIFPGPSPVEEKPVEEKIPPEEQAKPTVTIRKTETGFLNVRDGASVATPIIAQVNPGDSYELLEENETGDWYEIQVDDNTAGWVATRYVQKNE